MPYSIGDPEPADKKAVRFSQKFAASVFAAGVLFFAFMYQAYEKDSAEEKLGLEDGIETIAQAEEEKEARGTSSNISEAP